MEPIEYARMDAAEGRMWWYRALHANLLDALRRNPGPPGSPILDAGCGTGGLLQRLADVAPGRLRLGVDASPTAAMLARGKAGASAAVAVASVNALPFAAASIGVVVSADVLYHRDVEPRAAVAEACRCLMPRGVLIVNVPAYRWMTSSHDRQVHGARRFDRAGLTSLLAAGGFSGIRAAYWNSLLFPLMVLRRKVAPPSPDSSDVSALPALLERVFGAIAAAERRSMLAGVRYPFGGSVLAVATR
jgi:SAM-dependent methyltransferase